MQHITRISPVSSRIQAMTGGTWETHPNRKAWLDAKRSTIGASESAAVCKVSPYSSPLKVWVEKKAQPTDEQNKFTTAGLYLEDAIARWFRDQTGVRLFALPRGMFLWKAHGLVSCTPDFLCFMTEEDASRLVGDRSMGGMGLLEVKNTSAYMEDAWEKAPPPHVVHQVQHQMMVTGAKWAFVVVLIGGNDFRWYFVPANLMTHQMINEEVTKFIEDSLIGNKEPDPIGDIDRTEIDAKFPNPDGTIALDARAADWDDEAQELADMVRENTKHMKDLKARIAAAIGDHTTGVLPSGDYYTYRFETRKKKAQPKSESRTRVLRRRKKK